MRFYERIMSADDVKWHQSQQHVCMNLQKAHACMSTLISWTCSVRLKMSLYKESKGSFNFRLVIEHVKQEKQKQKRCWTKSYPEIEHNARVKLELDLLQSSRRGSRLELTSISSRYEAHTTVLTIIIWGHYILVYYDHSLVFKTVLY